MTIWFTSDTHFSHARIIELAHRPFSDYDHMDAEIVRRWNSVVHPDDTVFHLGDVALGPIATSLPRVAELNGYKILVEGNHDRMFMDKRKEEKRQRWLDEYSKYFDETYEHFVGQAIGSHIVNLSHFPYDGDSHGADRHAEARLRDAGSILIHGHTHLNNVVSRSKAGSLQIHVGVDAWDYYPVHIDQVEGLIEANTEKVL